jgi:hypothetical protein
MRRLILAVAVAALSPGAIAGAAGAAEPPPPYEGGMNFPAIQGPADPEEYPWEVRLEEGQVLEAADDRHAVVRWEGGQVAFTITAEPAHDASGATVPTTLAVSAGNVVTLTVHHRAGNPAAGGAPFAYPVTAGAGWESGSAAVVVQVPPPAGPVVDPAPALRCVVPNLLGRSLRGTRRQLRRAHCKPGPVRGQRARGAKVVRQYRPVGKTLPAGTEVGVKLIT